MRSYLGLGSVPLLMAATVSAYNETTKTVTVTSWSTIGLCPPPVTTTVALCDAQCAMSTPNTAANIVYETISNCQAGQVVNIGDTVTTLAQATTLTLEETISNLVLVPGAATNNDYTASMTIDSTIYPSSMTAYSGEIVTCQTGTTIFSSDGVVLTNCPCTVQSTVLEVTATSINALPSAVAPTFDYIVKIIYVYIIEYINDSIPTQVTSTAISTLTTIQTEIVTDTTPDIVSSTPRPSMATVDGVVFLLDYDTTTDGLAAGNPLRKRQEGGLPGISTDLYACLSQCATSQDCVALTFAESSLSCRLLVQFDEATFRRAPRVVFATAIFRPAVTSSAMTSSSPSTSLSSRSTSLLALKKSSPVISSRVSSGSSTAMTSASRSTPRPEISSSLSVSSRKSGFQSLLYPIPNSSAISTSSDPSSSSSSIVSVSVTESSMVSVGSISRSTFSSSSGSSSISSTSSGVTGSSSMNTSSSSRTSSSATLPVSISSMSTRTSSVPFPVSTQGCSLGNPALNLFTDETYVSEANAFCSSYLEITAVTETAYSTSTAYRVANVTTTLTLSPTITEQLPDATVTSVSTEIYVETVTTTPSSYRVLDRRIAAPGVSTITATSFASRIATISAPLLSAGCSCIQSRIPVSTATNTMEQQVTVPGLNSTATSTIEEFVTISTQKTTLVTSVVTTTSTTTAHAVVQTCTPLGGACDSMSSGVCCSGTCVGASIADLFGQEEYNGESCCVESLTFG